MRSQKGREGEGRESSLQPRPEKGRSVSGKERHLLYRISVELKGKRGIISKGEKKEESSILGERKCRGGSHPRRGEREGRGEPSVFEVLHPIGKKRGLVKNPGSRKKGKTFSSLFERKRGKKKKKGYHGGRGKPEVPALSALKREGKIRAQPWLA